MGNLKIIMERTMQDMVNQFMEKFKHKINPYPQEISVRSKRLRIDLMREELKELESAMRVDVGEELAVNLGQSDLVEVADGIADLLYVVLGTASAYGIDINPVFEEVHRNNMAKENGYTNGRGKYCKPEGHPKPDIKSILIKQGMKTNEQ